MVLSLAGGILGIVLAIAITRAVVALMPEFYVPNEARITVNGYVLAFSAAISILTGILFGLAPALQCSKLNLVETLKDAGKGAGAGSAGKRTRSLLVVAEVALSVVLLVGAGLTVRGFVSLQQMDVGFQPDRVLMVGRAASRQAVHHVGAAGRVHAEPAGTGGARNPGAQAAAIGNGGLPFGGPRSRYSIAGHPAVRPDPMMLGLISADYQRTLGIPLLGRRAVYNAGRRARRARGADQSGRREAVAGRTRARRQAHSPRHAGAAAAGLLATAGRLRRRRHGGRDPGQYPQRRPAQSDRPGRFLPYTVIAPTGRTLAIRVRDNPMSLLNAVREAGPADSTRNFPWAGRSRWTEVMGVETRAASFQHGAVLLLRRAGAHPGGDRDLQRALLQRGAAHARDRCPHGAWRGARTTS